MSILVFIATAFVVAVALPIALLLVFVAIAALDCLLELIAGAIPDWLRVAVLAALFTLAVVQTTVLVLS